MSIWQTLDIAPTRDAAEIRRAYARQLRQCRPDRDPVGYQQLREAFDEAKRLAAANEEEVDVDTDAFGVVPELERDDDIIVPLRQEVSPLLPEADAFYRDDELQTLAHQLVNTEMMGVARLTRLWSRVSGKGSLGQQQRFHQDLASALARQSGLTEGLLERVANQLEWRLEDYDYSHIIPEPVQHALQHQLRETELARARTQLDVEEKHGSILNRMALRLLRSDRQTVPFWLRLIPGAITALSRQVNHLLYYYPEIVSQLNPTLLQFLQQPRAALSWQGIFMLGYWYIVFNAALQISGASTVVSATAIATVMFYLFVSDMIMLGLKQKPPLLWGFMIAECIFSVIVMLLFFGGLTASAVLSIPDSGHGAKALAALIYIFVLMIVFWLSWPKDVPLIRKPGIAMSRILTSPWRLMEWMNFSWFSPIWMILYCSFCAIAMTSLFKLFSGF